MKFEYDFEGMKLKVLDETFAGKVLEFYSRNREEFDRYEAAKPDNFYTTEYITATLKAEYAALLKGECGRFFLRPEKICRFGMRPSFPIPLFDIPICQKNSLPPLTKHFSQKSRPKGEGR